MGQCISSELFGQRNLNQLCANEPQCNASFQNKRQSLEFVLELHSHANFFSFEVENSVTKVNENESFLVRISRFSVQFKFDKLVFAM